MSASHFVLLVDSDRNPGESLAAGLVRLGVEPIRVEDLEAAVATAKSREYQISGILLPVEFPAKQIYKAMKRIRKVEPALMAIGYGKRPNEADCKTLRRAGVLLALWEGYDEGMLRFQVNRLVSGKSRGSERSARRAPTHSPIRISIGGREKTGVLYSISEAGCFIESPRASMEGAELRLFFELEGRDFILDGAVAFANVPGNLQRPNLPLGMGVHFQDVPADVQRALVAFVQGRLEALEV